MNDPAARAERIAREAARLDRLARELDARWALPGTRFRFGWDVLLGLIPGGGDLIAALIGLWILWRAARLRAPVALLARMAGNWGVDLLLGAVPLLGDVADFFWQSNLRNIRLFNRWAAEPEATARDVKREWLALLLLVPALGLIALAVLAIWALALGALLVAAFRR